MHKKILAISWNIATDPKLYRELGQNPYASNPQKIISEKFPKSKKWDVIRAIILAEPEGKHKGPDTITDEELHKKLISYYKSHKKEIEKLPAQSIYDLLMNAAFGSNNTYEIENKYSQNMRRDLKLAIIYLIENKHKKQFVKGLSLVLTSVILFFIVFFFLSQRLPLDAIQNSKIIELPASNIQQKSLEFPVHLFIPSIHVDANIEGVGVTLDGSMEVPSNVYDAGWFNLGPSPGNIGSAVIAGHFDGKDGKSAVFNNIKKLKEGDMIFVTNNLSKINTFVVKDNQEFAPGYAPSVFAAKDKASHLNLITCDGIWDLDKKSYSKRLVVFADLIN